VAVAANDRAALAPLLQAPDFFSFRLTCPLRSKRASPKFSLAASRRRRAACRKRPRVYPRRRYLEHRDLLAARAFAFDFRGSPSGFGRAVQLEPGGAWAPPARLFGIDALGGLRQGPTSDGPTSRAAPAETPGGGFKSALHPLAF